VFKPTFEKAAKEYAGKALFLSVMGDANKSTAAMMKRLAIKAVPCFIGFKGGAEAYKFSGANKEKFAEELAKHA
jgi:thioredoxin-like negative regulator of GroEL